jgi:hypothetical protein
METQGCWFVTNYQVVHSRSLFGPHPSVSIGNADLFGFPSCPLLVQPMCSVIDLKPYSSNSQLQERPIY